MNAVNALDCVDGRGIRDHWHNDKDNDLRTNVGTGVGIGISPNGGGGNGNRALSLTQEVEDQGVEPRVAPRELG